MKDLGKGWPAFSGSRARAVLFFAVPAAFAAVPVHLSGLESSAKFRVSSRQDSVAVEWNGSEASSVRLVLDLAAPDRLVSELSIVGGPFASRAIILRDATPAYSVYVGRRHGSWEDNYFDNPSTRPHETDRYVSRLLPEDCKIVSEGNRLRITIAGLWMGIFHGDLVFTLFAGSSLVKQEAVVSTQEPNIAYYYDAWLDHCSTTQLNRLFWLSDEDKFEEHLLLSDIDLEGPHLKVHRRMLIAQGSGRSLAVFPPPHQYFFARDETINYGNLWYQLYSIGADSSSGDLFRFGIRQTPYSEEANKAPLVNAPPGTIQRMAMFWYVAAGSAQKTFNLVSAYTHNDSFVSLPGRKTFTSHYHLAAVMDWRRHNRKAYTPDFVSMFRRMGVNIVDLMDFHTDGHARDTGETRLGELQDYFALTRLLSGPNFLLIPGEELWDYFGGHWSLLLPRPTYYFLRRNPAQAFEDNIGPAGKAYRIGSAEEMLELIQREHGVAWQTHPRTKGSVGFPDAIKDQPFFKDSIWLGAGFKAMPSDNSSPRLGERALNLLDDMSNWGDRKLLIGEVDVFKLHREDELYGHMNINYLKLDRVPSYGNWSSVVEALRSGDLFVTTGEVLIREFTINGRPAGASAALGPNGEIVARADIEWTFPLNFLELVWGNGAQTFHKIIPAPETSEFGRKTIAITVSAPNAKWTRLAVWDTAADGAFTEPVRFDADR